MELTGRTVKTTRGGQSTLEYLLVFAAIIVGVIIAAMSMMKPAVESAIGKSQTVIETNTGNLKTRLGLL